MRDVGRNIPDEDKEEVAKMLKEALEDEAKMKELDAELNLRRYSKSANTIDKFSQDLWNYKAFPKDHWRGSGLLMGWRESIRNSKEEAGSLVHSRMKGRF